jgi:TolA-binding protein
MAPAGRGTQAASTPDDALAREAALVTQAREALGRGEPREALRAIHAARMLPSHQLGPEELAVEALALRALGKDDQAKDVDSILRKRFPESALAR